MHDSLAYECQKMMWYVCVIFYISKKSQMLALLFLAVIKLQKIKQFYSVDIVCFYSKYISHYIWLFCLNEICSS